MSERNRLFRLLSCVLLLALAASCGERSNTPSAQPQHSESQVSQSTDGVSNTGIAGDSPGKDDLGSLKRLEEKKIRRRHSGCRCT